MRKLLRDKPIPAFGVGINVILNRALEKFDSELPHGIDGKMYKAKRAELWVSLTALIKPLFVQQIDSLLSSTLERFEADLCNKAVNAADILKFAESEFVREASASIPDNVSWDFESEYHSLVAAMHAVLSGQRLSGSSSIVSTRSNRKSLLSVAVRKHVEACINWAIILMSLRDTDVLETLRTDTWKTLRMQTTNPRQQVAKVANVLGVGYAPRIVFLTGLMLRSLHMSTKVRYILSPSAGYGAGAMLAATYAQREWLPCFLFGWGIGGAYWSVFRLRPPCT